MEPAAWRLVVVRAWPHEGHVAAVLLVAEPGASTPSRRIAVGSVEEACAALGLVLRELTGAPTDPVTTD